MWINHTFLFVRLAKNIVFGLPVVYVWHEIKKVEKHWYGTEKGVVTSSKGSGSKMFGFKRCGGIGQVSMFWEALQNIKELMAYSHQSRFKRQAFRMITERRTVTCYGWTEQFQLIGIWRAPFPTMLSKALKHINNIRRGDEAAFSKLIILHTYS